MPKNILIFSDGTNQAGGLTPGQNVRNIYKLYRATRCGPDTNIDPREQLTFYGPGRFQGSPCCIIAPRLLPRIVWVPLRVRR
jgi:hypothetical protein